MLRIAQNNIFPKHRKFAYLNSYRDCASFKSHWQDVRAQVPGFFNSKFKKINELNLEKLLAGENILIYLAETLIYAINFLLCVIK